MADRFDILSQKLMERLEERQPSPAPGCISVALLEGYLAGKLTLDQRREVEAHLDNCLACLYTKVQLDDFLGGIAASGRLEPELQKRLWAEIRPSPRLNFPLPTRLWRHIQEALEWKVFVSWGLAGALAGMVGVTVVSVIQEQAQVVAPPGIVLRGGPESGSEPRTVPQGRSWLNGSPTWQGLATWGLVGGLVGVSLKLAADISRGRSRKSRKR